MKWETNMRQFMAMYGSNPIIYAEIIEDLQMTHIEKDHVHPKKILVENIGRLALFEQGRFLQ